MKLLLLLFITLAISIWLGIHIGHEPGQLYLSYGVYTVEMPLWVAVVATIILFIVCYCLLRIWSKLINSPERIRQWHARRSELVTYQQMMSGFQAMDEGDWQRAESSLLKASKNKKLSSLTFIHAARAAQQKYLLRCEKVQILPQHFCNAEENPDDI